MRVVKRRIVSGVKGRAVKCILSKRAIHVAAMSHVEYYHLLYLRVHLIDDAIIAHAYPIQSFCAFKFLYTVREGLIFQLFNSSRV